ncbi:MAG: hypothetical protein A2086_17155 [Spirochaetes bacterium GWD1_27_9]|nr:MAG: hypothetical protein A2Z98_02615 [Spirochaetes bacterium GWB1_27_13]OHD27313.1 MAG: hypothetical protein A2Y34_15940 [Spirochaetes bacterium GWC1_27_15]OHD34175.1 MAG: hypothetical protein A2086_17155 [Spirochaetes bacterium GWD1_27_9]
MIKTISKMSILLILVSILFIETLIGCGTITSTSTTTSINNSKSITHFSFDSIGVTGEIFESTHIIKIIVPPNTNVSALTPTIKHNGLVINPGTGVTQDFTYKSVTYTVTAADSSAVNYLVYVGWLPKISNITLIDISGTSAVAMGNITSDGNNTVIDCGTC